MQYRHLTVAALGLTIAALVAIGGLTYRRVDQLVEDERWLAQARDVMSGVTSVSSLVRDAESAQRGYILSGDDLQDYRRAQSLLSRQLEELRASTAEDAARSSRITALQAAVDESRELMAASMANRRDEGIDAARAGDRQRRGRELNRRVYALAEDFASAERAALDAHQQAATIEARATRQLILAAFMMAIGTSAFAGLRIRSELARQRAAEESARSAYYQVEERIRERTRELSEANVWLRSREEQFRAIAEVSPVHLFTTARDGAATYVSPGFSALTGLPPERVVGFGWAEALHPDDRGPVMTAWQEAIKSTATFQSDFRFREASGAYRWFKIHVVPVRDEQGEVVRWVGAAADIQEPQELLAERAAALEREQQARAEAERANQLKDDFLATVSHELRTPLNAIVGWVHVLRTGVLAPTDAHRAVEAIERNARAQARVVDDLLDVSRMMHGGLTLSVAPCDLRGVVGSVLETLEPATEAKHLTVDVQADVSEVVVRGDVARLKQVVWNLVSNAVKFTPKEGRVSVDVHRIGSRAVLTIADSGEGIDPAFLPHVFDPFRQGPSQSMRAGLGLGLAIVHELVGLHGGSIVAQSLGRGRGAAFTVSLPLEGSPARPTPAASRRATLNAVRVLVAEDDEDSALMVSSLLTHKGCVVRTVGTARELLSTLVEWHPHVLVCDVGLPDEDGYSLLRRVRAIDGIGRVPAIALTAHARDEDRVRALSAGYRAHLSKPLDPEALVREIGQASLVWSAG